MKPLHKTVTSAIFEAENHDRDGAKLWDRVAQCEKAIVDNAEGLYTDLETEIAFRGVLSAEARARFLRREETPPEDLAMEACRSRLRYLPDCCCPPCEARRTLQEHET